MQSSGWFVEDNDRCPADGSSGDGDALALALGEGHATLAEDSFVALRQGGNEVVRVGKSSCGLDLGHGSSRRDTTDILPNRGGEQNIILQNYTDPGAERLEREL